MPVMSPVTCVSCCALLQVDRARKQARIDPEQQEQEDEAARALQRDEDGQPIVLGLAQQAAAAAAGDGKAAGRGRPPLPPSSKAPLFEEDEEEGPGGSKAGPAAGQGRKLSKVEELMRRDLEAKQQAAARAAGAAGAAPGGLRQDSWLFEGIIVKVGWAGGTGAWQ